MGLTFKLRSEIEHTTDLKHLIEERILDNEVDFSGLPKRSSMMSSSI